MKRLGLDGWSNHMDASDSLTDLKRGKEDCVMRFADDQAFRVDYLDIRLACPCAKCAPRQENEQRIIEFREEVMRLRLDKPKTELVGRYGLRFSWPTGCSSGIFSFPLLRGVCEEKGTLLG